MNLPELPEPAYTDSALHEPTTYTEAQLLDYRAAVIEACAKEVEALERNGAWVTREEVLNAIRSLLK
jgi:hypothetical protein